MADLMIPKNCPHCGTMTSPAGSIDEEEFSAQCPACKATVTVTNTQYKAKDFNPLTTPSTKDSATAVFAAPLTSANVEAPSTTGLGVGAQAGTGTDPLGQNVTLAQPQPSTPGTPPAIAPGSEPTLGGGNVKDAVDKDSWR